MSILDIWCIIMVNVKAVFSLEEFTKEELA